MTAPCKTIIFFFKKKKKKKKKNEEEKANCCSIDFAFWSLFASARKSAVSNENIGESDVTMNIVLFNKAAVVGGVLMITTDASCSHKTQTITINIAMNEKQHLLLNRENLLAFVASVLLSAKQMRSLATRGLLWIDANRKILNGEGIAILQHSHARLSDVTDVITLFANTTEFVAPDSASRVSATAPLDCARTDWLRLTLLKSRPFWNS